MNVDIEKLRQDLIGAATPGIPIAIVDVTSVETAGYNELIEIARHNGFNLNDYVKEPYTKNLFR